MEKLSYEEFSKLSLNDAKEYLIQMIDELSRDCMKDLYENINKIVNMTDDELETFMNEMDIN